jgi:ferredoxin
MKATVDQDNCTGCELCIQTCPDVFVMENNLAKAKVDVVPPAAEAACQEAADSCPVACITLS